MLRIESGQIRIGGPIASPHDLLVRVVADIRVRSDDDIVLDEPDVPALELMLQISDWLTRTAGGNAIDFSYDSIEHEEPGILWFRSEGGRWRVGSELDGRRSTGLQDSTTVLTAARNFVDFVRNEMRRLGVDVTELERWYRSKGTPLVPRPN